MTDTLFYEKKYLTKNVKKGTDELSHTLLSENKSLTKKVEKFTDELADTLFFEKKYSTFGVDKGTDELACMKQKVHTIRRKGLNQFEGQSNGSKGWFKLDIECFKTTISKSR